MRSVSRKLISVLLIAASAGSAVAATQPVTASQCEISNGTLLKITLDGMIYPQSSFIPLQLSTWTAGNSVSVLVPDGTPVTLSAAERRALLETDWKLGTGLINPANSPTAVAGNFTSPVRNRPGADLIVFEMSATTAGDPFTLTINGTTRTIAGTDYGSTGYSFTGHDALSTATAATTLTALLDNALTLNNGNINQSALGVAIELSDFGVAENAEITSLTFGSSTTNYFDPVLIAGLGNGTAVPPPPPPSPPALTFSMLPQVDTAIFQWSSLPGSRHAILSSTTLDGPWTPEAVNILPVSQGGRRAIVTDLSLPRRFFRVTDYTMPPGTPQPEILVRSSWQTVNIGDIAHSPGVLQQVRQAFPHAHITLWRSSVDRGVQEMLLANFPDLEIVSGSVDASGVASNTALQNAWNRANILIHGSGPSIVAETDLTRWSQLTSKPYGFEGITISSVNDAQCTLLSGASFVYCRDTTSLGIITTAGVTAPVMEFGPDGTFAVAVRNDAAALAWMAANGLTEGNFLCVVPRLRRTPYWEINGSPYDAAADAYNQQWKEIDHAKLREVIIQWVRQTGKRVVACPEMTYQVALAKELLIDPLPADVKPSVVWKDSYWITDEAASVYARSAGVVSMECHSPIIAMANGVPAIYVRQPTDSIKGQMYRDIGANDWIMEVDDVTGSEIAARALSFHTAPTAARAYLSNAMKYVHQRQAASMAHLHTVLGVP